MVTGGLFGQYFLTDGIRCTDPYRALDAAEVEAARLRMAWQWRGLIAMPKPSEAETENVLRELGWDVD